MKLRQAARPRLLVEELERRILFSSDSAALLGLAGAVPGAEVRLLEPVTAAPPVVQPNATAQQSSAREIVFIDSRVPDAMKLADQLMQQSGGSSVFDIVILNANEDGVAQIDKILANEHGLTAIHIISHGSDGAIEIGSTNLDAARLAIDAKAVAQWGQSLAAGGDLLLYGCDVAQDAVGQAFVKQLAGLTGAAVAASTDATGSVVLGGNWTLEYDTGRIVTAVAPDAAVQQSWTGLLASNPPTVTNHALVFDGTDLVVVPSQPSLVMGSTVTIEASIQRTGALTGTQIIVNKEGEYEIGIAADGKLQWAFANATPGWNWVETSYTVPADTWVQLAVTYNNGVVKAYANGALVDTYNGSGTIGDVYPQWNDLTIGGRQDTTGQRFSGMIDEMRVWNVERSAAQIQATYNTPLVGNETGLVGYWRFDETSGATAIDSSPQGNNGLLGNGVPANAPARTTNLDYTIAENASLNVPVAGVLTGATDPQGSALTTQLISGPANASAFALNPDGSFSYTPSANFAGTDSFVFDASDGSLASLPATVVINVAPVNQAPVQIFTGANFTGAYTYNDASGNWFVQNSPVNTGTIQSQPQGGMLHLSSSAGGSSSSGVIIGMDGSMTLGNLQGASVASTGNALVMNLYLDTGNDGEFFSFTGNQFTGLNGDSYASVTLGANGGAIDGNTVFTKSAGVAGLPATFTLAQLLAGAVPGIDANTHVALWLGGGSAFSTDISSFAVAASTAANLTVPEGSGPTLLGLAGVAFGPGGGANEAGQTLTYTVTAVPNAAIGNVVLADGTTVVSANTSYTLAALQGMQFRANANANGAAGTFSFSVQDNGGVANGGQDTITKSLAINVTPNSAPVLAGAISLASINENPASNPGTLVSALISGQVSDADTGALQGIAVTGVDSSNGSWQYSSNGGTTWNALGTPSQSAALLLAADANTYVQFVPNAGWSGTDASGITFRAWDQTSGTAGGTADVTTNGGSTAFSAAAATAGITVNPTGTISGTIYEDVAGMGSLAGAVGSANVTVRLYLDNGDGKPDAADALVATATTDAAGVYSFSGLADATYWVTVDSKTVTPGAGFNPGFSASDVWAEQTYGAAGSVRYDGSSYTFTSAAGAFFGGMQGDVSDNASTLATAQDATRVTTSGNAITGVNSAFSFNVVTNTLGGDTQNDGGSANLTVQGSLRQFIENADAIAGPNMMRFVPAVAANASGGGGSWWSISVSNALPAITDASTTIDGTAYSATDGVTVLNTNPGQLGAGGAVGTDGVALAQVNTPELEIYADRTVPAASVVANGFNVNANNAEISDVSIYGFGRGLFNNNFADIHVGSGVSGTLIENNVIGAGASSFSDPGAASRTNGADILFDGAVNGTVRNNLIGFATGQGIWGYSSASGWTITGNEIRGNSLGAYFVAGIDIDAGANFAISGNLITGQDGPGINLNGTAASDVISDNTVVNNGLGTPANYTAGIRLGGGAGGLIDKNIVWANAGDGVMVTSGVSGVTISQNSIYGNGAISGGIGIDLLSPSDSQARGTAPYVTPNDPGDPDAGGNDLKNFPVLASATILSPTQITVTGSYNSLAVARTYQIELFASATADPSGYGQGQTYLGLVNVTTDASGNATFSAVLNASVTAGEVISATATDLVLNDTSEFSQCVVAKNPNSPPSGTSKTITTNENSAYTFATADFGFTDPGDSPPNSLLAVKVSSLPGAGALSDNGAAVSAGQFVSAADIAAGLLVFTPAANAAGAGYAAFTFQVQDNGGTAGGGVDLDPSPKTLTVNLAAVNVAPTLTATALNPSFTEAPGLGTQAAAVNVFSGAAASTVEAGQTITGLTFTVSGLVDGANEVIVVDGSTIALGATSAGTTATNALAYTSTLNAGTATIVLSGGSLSSAATQGLVNAITYQDTNADNPSAGNRVFTLTQIQDSGGTANGGADTTALAIASSVTVVPVNDAPTATNLNAAQTYTENTPLALTAIVASDVDSANLTATLTLSDVAAGSLNTATSGAVSSSYNAATGVWSASGATADVNALLAGLSFTPTSNFSGNFTIATSVSDASLSVSGSKAISTTAVNVAPTLTATALNPSFTEAPGLGTQAAAVNVFSGAAASTVEAGQTITGLTFTVSGLVDGANEVIVVDGSTIALGATSAGTTATNALAYTSTLNAGTATIVLSGGSLSSAATQGLVNAITYQDTNADNPSAGNRVFTLTQIQDSGGTANGGADTTALAIASSVTVVPVNDAPTATNLNAAQTYTENTPLALTAIVASDVDSANLTATLTLSDVAAGSLNTATSGAVSSSYNAATGVWSASGATADVNALLAGLSFTPTSNFSGNFTIATSVSDASLSVSGSKAISTTAVNVAPTLTATALNPSFTEAPGLGTQAAAVNVFSGAAASTVEAGQTITGLTFTVSGLVDGANEVIVVDGSTIALGATSAGTTATNALAYTSTLNAGTATIVLSGGSLSSAATQGLVNAITYQDTNADNPSAGNRVFTLTQIQDSGGTANGGADTTALAIASSVTVVPVNDAPTATNLNAAQTYTENTPLALTAIVASDVDSANLTATLTLSDVAAGSLNTATSGAVSSSYNAATGVWSASGATADVNALLAGLSFTPTSNFSGNFTIATSVSDASLSVSGSKAISTTAVNVAPTLTATALNPSFTEAPGLGTQAAAVNVFSGAAASTVEAGQTITGLTFTVSGLVDGANEVIVVDGSTIALGATSAGTTATNALAYTSTLNAGTATIVLSGGSLSSAATQGLVNAITYQDTNADNPSAGNRVFTLTQIQDSGGTANGGADTTALAIASSVTVVPVNDAPVIVTATMTLQAGQALVLGSAQLKADDVDSNTAALVFDVRNVNAGQFELVADAGVPITQFTQAQVTQGDVRFVFTNVAQIPSFDVTAFDGSARSASITVVASVMGVPAAEPAPSTAPPTESMQVAIPAVEATLPAAPPSSDTAVKAPTSPGDRVQPLGSQDVALALGSMQSNFGPTSTPSARTEQQAKIMHTPQELLAKSLFDLDLRIADDAYLTRVAYLPITDLLQSSEQYLRAGSSDAQAPGGTDTESHHEQAVTATVQVAQATGVALSVGAVWWALRAGGLMASLLGTLPMWRHVDLLAVLPDEEDKDDWDAEVDDEARRDEKAVGDVFEAANDAEPQ